MTAASIVDQALAHTMQLNASSLDRLLNEASIQLPRHAFLQLVVLSLFEKIGERWRAGKMKIINEHMASLIVRSILWDMLRSVDVYEKAPGIVVATPVGHWHKFGALASALAASESGWRVFFRTESTMRRGGLCSQATESESAGTEPLSSVA